MDCRVPDTVSLLGLFSFFFWFHLQTKDRSFLCGGNVMVFLCVTVYGSHMRTHVSN